MKTTALNTALGFLGLALSASAQAVNFNINVTNLTHGMFLGPVLVVAHPQASGVNTSPGNTASLGVQTLAENGDVTTLQSDYGVGADSIVLMGTVGGDKLGPGESVSTSNFISKLSNDRLSILCKLMPTNDGFAAVTSIVIPTAPGRYVYNLLAYDAGTEANDEVVVAGGDTVGTPGIGTDAAIPTGINGAGASGADSNTTIHIHRGALGDDVANGGISDLDINLHRWLNPVARVIIDVN